MPMKNPLLPTVAAGLLAALVLTGCGGEDKTPAPRTQLEYASMKDVRDINPHLYLGEMAAQAMVFEPLVFNTPEGVKPALAERWEISKDGREYLFHLRPNVKFTDGAPFDAQAVKLNFDAILDNAIRHKWLDMVNEIDAVEVVNPLTVRLRLKHAYFPTLVELGLSRPFRFISPRCMKSGGTKDGVSCLAGTGPWVLTDHKRGQYAVFTRNASYWGERPLLESVRWNVMPDAQTMLMALEKGEIDLVFGADGDQLSSDTFSALEKADKFRTAMSAPMASRAILVNSNRPITKDLAVREAIERAVNREAIVKSVLNGMETPAETLFAKNVPYCDVPLDVRPYDPAAARRILDEAGWTPGADGVRVKDGRPLELEFYFNAQNAQERTIAEAVQADLKSVGIALKVIGEEKQTYLDRQRSGFFDLQYALSWGAPYDPQSFFSSWRIPAHGDYQAQIGLADKPEIDREIGQFLVTLDDAERHRIAADILTRIHKSAVYVPLSFSRTKAVYSTRLQGVGFAVTQYEIPFERMSFITPTGKK